MSLSIDRADLGLKFLLFDGQECLGTQPRTNFVNISTGFKNNIAFINIKRDCLF